MKQANTSYSWKRDPLLWAYSALMLIPVIMVFITYNYYQLSFCVYTGWALLVFNIVLIFLAGYEFRMRGGAPEGESIVHTTVVVDSGVYSAVRHPQYLGFILFVFALVLMSQHWFSLFSSILGSALYYKDILREEQMSTIKFGDEYERYMQKVPRMNLLLGVIRLLNKKRE